MTKYVKIALACITLAIAGMPSGFGFGRMIKTGDISWLLGGLVISLVIIALAHFVYPLRWVGKHDGKEDC